MIPDLYEHQKATRDFILDNPRNCVFSDPGTGKTRSVLSAIEERKSKALVFCPKAIMVPAWVEDCRKFIPRVSICAAPAKGRRDAFEMGTDVVVTNHDAVKWVSENPELAARFDTLVVDESTAYKNPNSLRSRAIVDLKDSFEHRTIMTGTPIPNKLVDIWNQAFIVDDGERLGARYYAFRHATHEPVTLPNGVTLWQEKAGAREVVADLLSDITIRYKLEDCIDMPKNVVNRVFFTLSPKAMKKYTQMRNEMATLVEQGVITASNAAVQVAKLLQIASGAVYGATEHGSVIDTARYDLIAQLCAERPHTLVAFLWKHQRDEIIKALERQGIDTYAVIDGDAKGVPETVSNFQAGKYRVLLAHPQSAGHGLTLTRATTTIWASPTYNAEHFIQFNARINRAGQTQRTETILICAAGTIDPDTFDRVEGKVERQSDLLSLLQDLSIAA